jgi:hypothetical protein
MPLIQSTTNALDLPGAGLLGPEPPVCSPRVALQRSLRSAPVIQKADPTASVAGLP